MNLSPAQFPTNSWNPFAAMAGRVGKSKTNGLVSNQEHEGENLQRAIVVGAVQHHFAMQAGAKQHEWSEQAAASQHVREQERLKTGAKLFQGGEAFSAKVGDSEFQGMRARSKPKQPATPTVAAPKLVENGPGGKIRRKQP